MNDYDYFIGVDWGREMHQACLIDGHGQVSNERSFEHGAHGLNALAEWILNRTGGANVAVGIEIPHGPVVETLMERQLAVYAINPKQLDRFRDRVSPAGAKDDRLDARVLAMSLRTDRHCFRHLQPSCAVIVELRELSRIIDDLTTARVRLVNRIRQLLWRYYPQFLDLEKDLSKPWVTQLWQLAPTPAQAKRLRKTTVEKLLKQHRIRRINAETVLKHLNTPAITVAAGTEQAVCTSLKVAIGQLELNQSQASEINQRIDQLIEQLTEPTTDETGIDWQRDVAILSSIPGVGRIVLATLLAEAWNPLQRRDREALRCLCGVAPVTKRSGKSHIVIRRLACNDRLRNAIHYWAQSAAQHDPISKEKYNTMRDRGHSHARALRGIGDRLLNVACAMLKNQTEFDLDLRVSTIEPAA